MRDTLLKPLFLLAMLAVATPAIAQDEGTTEPAAEQPAAEEPAAETGDSDPNLDMGEVVDETQQPGTTYVDQVFGDWERKCVRNPDGEDPCQLYQLLKDANGTPTAEMTVLKLPAGQQAAAGSTVVVPLQTLLTQQLTVSIDGGQTKRYPFRFCTAVGCFSQIGLTEPEVAAFKRGVLATITIVPAGAPDQKVVLPVSLSGFTAGFDSLVEPPAQQ